MTIEEPLEIRLAYGEGSQRRQQSISITMRTPGHDEELAIGFLLSEGIIAGPQDVQSVAPCGPPVPPMGLRNVVRVDCMNPSPWIWPGLSDIFIPLQAAACVEKPPLRHSKPRSQSPTLKTHFVLRLNNSQP